MALLALDSQCFLGTGNPRPLKKLAQLPLDIDTTVCSTYSALVLFCPQIHESRPASGPLAILGLGPLPSTS